MGPRAITRLLTEPLVRICYCVLLLASFFIFAFLLSYHSIVGALHGHSLTVFSHMHLQFCRFHMLPFNFWVHTTGLGASKNVAFIFGGYHL